MIHNQKIKPRQAIWHLKKFLQLSGSGTEHKMCENQFGSGVYAALWILRFGCRGSVRPA